MDIQEQIQAQQKQNQEAIRSAIPAKPKVDTTAIKEFIANFIIPIGSLLASVALFILVIYPIMGQLSTLEAERDAQLALEAQLSEKLSKLSTLVEFKPTVEEYSTLTSSLLSEEPEVPELLTQIDQIAREAGINVTQLSYSLGGSREDAKGTQTVFDIVVAMGGSGNFQQVIAFLDATERAGRILSVNSFRYSLNDSGNLNINLSLVSPYVQVETDAVTDDPITFDLNDPQFLTLIESIKGYRIYDISVEDYIDVQETPQPAETETTPGVDTTPPDPSELPIETPEADPLLNENENESPDETAPVQ